MRKEKDYLLMLERLVGAIESGDPNLHGHSLFVMRIASMMYDFMPFNYRIKINRDDLQLAALLLNIGRICIPDEVINNQGKYSKEEMEIIRKHPGIAEEILGEVDSFKKIAFWIKYQHERVDGKGYYGLKADEIPAASKLLAVADTFSAIIMNRTYKAKYNYEDALVELKLSAGHQLDEEFVGFFCSIPVNMIVSAFQEVREEMNGFSQIREKIDNIRRGTDEEE